MRLTEVELAQRLGVSRVPLREAFRVLEAEGIVTIQPHKGVVISPLSTNEMLELFKAREMIEGAAAEHLAISRDPAAIFTLARMSTEMRAAIDAEDLNGYYRLAASFHDTLIAASGNRILERFYSQIRFQLRRYQLAMSGVPDSPLQSIGEHEALLACIRDGHVEEAVRLAREHVRALVVRFREIDQSVTTSPQPEPQKRVR